MTDKQAQAQAPDDDAQDTNDMMALKGRHVGHTLRRVGSWWLCSCSKEVKRDA